MKISVFSDLHTEFDADPYIPPYNPDVDVMILAGDCFVAGNGYDWIDDLMTVHYRTPYVLFVPGNHDFYNCNFMDLFNRTMEKKAEEYPNFCYMNRQSIEICGVNFHGATLWTSFDAYGPLMEFDLMSTAEDRLADFTYIPGMSPQIMQTMARKDQKFFSDVLAKNRGKTNVCISHFPPLVECKNENFETNSMSPYFNNDLANLIRNMDCGVWVYGHNHYNDPFFLYDTRFISNQRGYAALGEGDKMGIPFNDHFVIEV